MGRPTYETVQCAPHTVLYSKRQIRSSVRRCHPTRVDRPDSSCRPLHQVWFQARGLEVSARVHGTIEG